MDSAQSGVHRHAEAPSAPNRRERWFAAGGVLGAILASTCCIVPLVLVLLGVSGAWIGNLTALEPYRLYFMGAAAVLIGLGFWRVYFRTKAECADDSYCARPRSSRITKAALWGAAILVALNLTLPWWAPFFY